jgi:hypothetical protein
MGGAMNITSLPDRGPLRLALKLMASLGGHVAAAATMTGGWAPAGYWPAH